MSSSKIVSKIEIERDRAVQSWVDQTRAALNRHGRGDRDQTVFPDDVRLAPVTRRVTHSDFPFVNGEDDGGGPFSSSESDDPRLLRGQEAVENCRAESELSTIIDCRERRERAPEPSTDGQETSIDGQRDAGIHRLQQERQPELRLLFQQPDDAVRIHVTAAQELRVQHGAESSLRDRVLGVTHSRTELRCSLEADRIKATMFFVPLKDDMVLYNDSGHTLSLEKVPSGGFDSRSLLPKQYELVYPGFWRLYDNKTSVEFLLRPCRYRLFLSTEANKRLAREELPPPKRGMLSTGSAATGATTTPPTRVQKTIMRRELANVDLLNSTGLEQSQTLHMVDELTGQMEYSLRFKERYTKTAESVDVFKAVWDECSKSRVVAVKRHRITTAEPYSIAAAIKGWERELNAHKDLDHPCIAKLLAFDSRLLALIIEDRNLHDLSSPIWCPRSGPLAFFFKGDIDDACRVATDMSSALGYLDRQGIVHNDIRPSNIIYGGARAEGKSAAGALLIDFGLSRVMKMDDNEDRGGTPWYMAPERMEGKRGPPGDIYSLGVVMLYLLRSIRVPEKEKPWPNAARQEGHATVAALKSWLQRVREESDRLQGIAGSKKEKQLRRLVVRMLQRKSDRIAADDLVKATREWAD